MLKNKNKQVKETGLSSNKEYITRKMSLIKNKQVKEILQVKETIGKHFTKKKKNS